MQTGAGAEVTFDGLHRLDHARLQRVWVKPGATLAPYRKLLVMPASIHYKRPPDPGRYARENFALTEAQMERLRRELREAFVEELTADGGWAIVTQPGPDVLLARGALVDLVVNVPPDRGTARDRIYLDTLGEVTLVAEFFDSQTREILVRVAERRAVQSADGTMRSTSVNNTQEVRRVFNRWARIFREGLGQARTIQFPEAQ
jgi:hypothetical protein